MTFEVPSPSLCSKRLYHGLGWGAIYQVSDPPPGQQLLPRICLLECGYVSPLGVFASPSQLKGSPKRKVLCPRQPGEEVRKLPLVPNPGPFPTLLMERTSSV